MSHFQDLGWADSEGEKTRSQSFDPIVSQQGFYVGTTENNT